MRGIQHHNIEVPTGTPVEAYGELVRSIAGPRKIVTRFRGVAATDLAAYQRVEGLRVKSWGENHMSLPSGQYGQWNDTMQYFAFAHDSSITLYNGELQTAIQTIPLPDLATHLAWHGDYLAVVYIYQPYFSIFKLVGFICYRSFCSGVASTPATPLRGWV